MSALLNIKQFVRFDDQCNLHVPNKLFVGCQAYVQTPLLSDNSNRVATTEWVKAYATGGGIGGSIGSGIGGAAAEWIIDTVAPTSTVGKESDLYLNSTNGFYYKKINSVWVFKGVLMGPAGAPGAPGAPGNAGEPGEAGYSPTTQELLDLVFDVQGNYYTEKLDLLLLRQCFLK